jgi:hypothetical protein
MEKISTFTVWKRNAEGESNAEGALQNSTIQHSIDNIQYRIIPKKVRDIPVNEVPLAPDNAPVTVGRFDDKLDSESDFEYASRVFNGTYLIEGVKTPLELTLEQFDSLGESKIEFIDDLYSASGQEDLDEVQNKYFNLKPEEINDRKENLYVSLDRRLYTKINATKVNAVDRSVVMGLTEEQLISIENLLSDPDLSNDDLLTLIQEPADEYMDEEITSRMLHIPIMKERDNTVPFREIFTEEQRSVLEYLLKNCK